MTPSNTDARPQLLGGVTRPSCAACGGDELRVEIAAAPDRFHKTPSRCAVAVCATCGAGLTLPRVDDATLARFYPATYGPYDVASGRIVSTISGLIQRWLAWRALRTSPLKRLRSLPPGRLLEVGPGRGDLAAMLVMWGWQVTAVEPSAAACRHLEARGIDARCGTLADVDLERDTYDVAFFNHALEHVSDPLEALRCIRSTLRPRGLLLITVPNFECWQRRIFGSRWFHLELPRHRVHFSLEAMRRLVDRAGFQLLELGTSSSAVGLPASLQYALFGRCLFPHGLSLRLATGGAAVLWPVAAMANSIAGSSDLIHVAARRND